VKPLALALVLAACGAPEVELPETPTIEVGISPRGVEILPPGWYVHAYPGLCLFLIRNKDGEIEACYIDPDPTCKPVDHRGCRAFNR